MRRLAVIAAVGVAGIGIIAGLAFLFAPLGTQCSISVGATAGGPIATAGPQVCRSTSLVQIQPIWPMPLLAIVVWSMAPSITAAGVIQRLRGKSIGKPWIAIGLVAEATVLISAAAAFFVPLVLLPMALAIVLGMRASRGS